MLKNLFADLGSPRERVILGVWWLGLGILLLRGNTILENWATLFVGLWSGFLLVLALVLTNEGRFQFPRILGWSLIGVLVSAIISTATTIHPDASVRELLRLVSFGVLVLILTALFRPPHRWRWAAQSIVVLAAAITIGSLVAFFREGPPSADHQLRGPFFWYNQMGAFLATSVPLFLGVLAAARTARTTWLSVGLVLLTLGALVLTFSRGSWLAALFVLPVTFFALRLPRKRILALLLVSGLLGSLLVAQQPALRTSLRARASSILREARADHRTTSGNIRADAVWVTKQAARERTFFGTGPGTFADDFLRFQRAPWRYAAHAHNEPLEMFAELGVAGGSSFALFLLSAAALATRALRQVRRSGRGERDQLLLGAVAAGVLVFLLRFLIDVDWSFLGLQALFASLLALLIARTLPAHSEVVTGTARSGISRRAAGVLAVLPLALAGFLGIEELHTRTFTAELAVNNLFGASHAADRLLRFNPWSGTGNLLRGRMAFLQQDFDRAEAAYQRAADLLPFRVEAPLGLASIAALRNDRLKAEEAFRSVMRRTPFYAPLPALRVARFRRQAGDLDGAEQVLRETVEQHFPLNEDLSALYYFLRYTPAGESLPALYRSLVRVYEINGKPNEAAALREQWKRHRELPPLDTPDPPTR